MKTASMIQDTITRLSRQVYEVEAALRISKDELKETKEAVDEFLREYLSRLPRHGSLLMPSSSSMVELVANHKPVISSEEQQLHRRKRRSVRQHELKRVYRRLVKCLHPDACPGKEKESALVFDSLHRYYEEGDLQALLAVEAFIEGQQPSDIREALHGISPVEQLEQIERRHIALTQELQRVQSQIETLYASDEYALYRRSLWYRMCGKDFLDSVELQLNRA